ncbi:MAG TPA: DUF1707 domain-containing protein [Streptosporangiaceae bacterium]|nr:DUF1707 domain-containing protein [Streptosporangiaceae bacterium]
MRVSDADRAEVADRLAQHYGDGRLDQTELDDRLGRAMSAKTRADLDGLLHDLPDTGVSRMESQAPRRQPPRQPRQPREHSWLRMVLILVLVLVGLRLLGGIGGLFWPFGWFWGWMWPGPWLLIALLVFLWLRFGRRRRYRD